MKKLIAVLLCVFSASVFADSSISFPTGNDFYSHCKNIKQNGHLMNFGFCLGSVTTAFDDTITFSALLINNKKIFDCYYNFHGFSSFNAEQVLDITMKYLKDHPEDRQFKMGTIMAGIFGKHFPIPASCKDK